jgi:hypothetical protein
MIWYLSIANVRDNWPDDTGFIWNREMGSQGQQKRPRTGILTDESVYLHLPENALDILIGAFLDRANQGEMLEPADLSPAEVAWCRCVFALITMGCLAGQQALEEIFGLQFRDVLPISAGYILIPRAGGHYPIYVPQSVIPFVLSLLNHLTRGRGPGRNRQGTFPEDGFVLPRREVPTRMVGLDEHRHYQEMFRAWLMGLGKSVGFYIPVGRLISLARGRVLRHYSPPIAATLLGIHLLNPASVDQEGAVQLYRLELDWEWVVGQKLGSTALNARPHHRLSGKNVPAKAVCHPDLPGCLLQLKQIVSIYGTAEKTLARTIRRQVIRNLHHFALGEELTAGKKAGEDWSQFFQRHAARGFTWYQVDAINTCLLAQWFITQIRSHVPNTVNARLADIMLVMRQHPTRMLVHIEVKDILDSIGESMVASSRRARVGDSLKQFYRYIQTTLGLQVEIARSTGHSRVPFADSTGVYEAAGLYLPSKEERSYCRGGLVDRVLLWTSRERNQPATDWRPLDWRYPHGYRPSFEEGTFTLC